MQSAAPHAGQLRAGEVGPYLVMHGDVTVGIGQTAEKRFCIFRGHDVVDGEKIKTAVTAGERFQLLNNVINALGAEFHAGAVQAAESTVIFLSPPATARSLNWQLHGMGPPP